MFFEKSEAAPFSVTWDTTGVADGAHTIRARMTKFDETEIWSNPVTVTVANAAPPTALEVWRAGYFSAADLADPLKEPTVWGNAADPDGDGNRNWKEYALGGNPLDPTDVNLHMRAQVAAGTGGDPVLRVTYSRNSSRCLPDHCFGSVPMASLSSSSSWTRLLAASL